MANDDETLHRYLETVLRLRSERKAERLTQDDLRQIALETGITEEDLAYVEQCSLDHINRGEGFIRYGNWDGAIEELELALEIVPDNIAVLNALATAHWNRSKIEDDETDWRDAQEYAEQVLQLDSRDYTALKLISAIKEKTTKEEHAVKMQEASAQALVVRRGIITAAVIFFIAALGFGVVLMFVLNSDDDEAQSAEQVEKSENEQPPAPALSQDKPSVSVKTEAAPDTGFARLVQEFGSEGIGAGMFTDARSIAVGGDKIYVGEYGSGRIQVFDSAGAYLTQWNIGKKRYLKGLAADRNGVVYAAHNGGLFRYEGATGKELGALRYGQGPGFTDVSMAADGGLVTSWDGNWRGGIMVNPTGKDDIVRFDRNGKVVRAIRSAISTASDEFEWGARVAIDGLDNIYALGTYQHSIFKFSPEGKFVTRFGANGQGAGKLSSPGALAVDGHGRVYVADFPGVHVFDAEGTYLGTIDMRGVASGLAFNDRGELLVVARTKVLRFVIRK